MNKKDKKILDEEMAQMSVGSLRVGSSQGKNYILAILIISGLVLLFDFYYVFTVFQKMAEIDLWFVTAMLAPYLIDVLGIVLFWKKVKLGWWLLLFNYMSQVVNSILNIVFFLFVFFLPNANFGDARFYHSNTYESVTIVVSNLILGIFNWVIVWLLLKRPVRQNLQIQNKPNWLLLFASLYGLFWFLFIHFWQRILVEYLVD